MDEREFFIIVTSHCVQRLRAHGEPLGESNIRFYPDGSFVIDSKDVPKRWSFLKPIGSSLFRTLGSFGTKTSLPRFYKIYYPATCDWMGQGENWVLTYPGALQEVSPAEGDLSQVHVLVRLRRKFTPEVAAELSGVLRRWFIDVGSRGVFGETGIKSLPPQVQYREKCAGFVLDATGSGQETLNTLYLAVLNWGIDLRRPLVMIDLTGKPEELAFSSDLSVPFE